MKKVITRPDGTKEEIEGTPEEIARYERELRERVNEDQKKPGLIKGAGEKSFGETILDEFKKSFPTFDPFYSPVRGDWPKGYDEALCLLRDMTEKTNGPLLISCPCRRCSIYCGTLSNDLVVGGPQWSSSDIFYRA